VVFIVGIV